MSNIGKEIRETLDVYLERDEDGMATCVSWSSNNALCEDLEKLFTRKLAEAAPKAPETGELRERLHAIAVPYLPESMEDQVRAMVSEMLPLAEALAGERDKWKSHAESACDQVARRMNECEEMRVERDEARARAETFKRAWLDATSEDADTPRPATFTESMDEVCQAVVDATTPRPATGDQPRPTEGVRAIWAERERQRTKWGDDRDDEHGDGSLSVVASILAVWGTDANVADPLNRVEDKGRDAWGLIKKHGDTRDRRKLLAIAGALIAAEYDRETREIGSATSEDPDTKFLQDRIREFKEREESGDRAAFDAIWESRAPGKVLGKGPGHSEIAYHWYQLGVKRGWRSSSAAASRHREIVASAISDATGETRLSPKEGQLHEPGRCDRKPTPEPSGDDLASKLREAFSCWAIWDEEDKDLWTDDIRCLDEARARREGGEL